MALVTAMIRSTGFFRAKSNSLRGMAKAVAWMYPYMLDKKTWPKPPDVTYDKEWPIAQPCLIFAGMALGKPEYIDLWKKLDHDPTVEEVLRNWPVRQPVLW